MIDAILESLGEEYLRKGVNEGLGSISSAISMGQISFNRQEALEQSEKDENAWLLLKETGLMNLVERNISPNKIKSEVETVIATMDAAVSFVDSHKTYFSQFMGCDVPSFFDIYRSLGALTGDLREEKIQKYIEEFEYNLNQRFGNLILARREEIRKTIDDAFLQDKRYNRYLNDPLPDGAVILRDAIPYAFSDPNMSAARFKTELSNWFSREIKNIDQFSDALFSEFKSQIQEQRNKK